MASNNEDEEESVSDDDSSESTSSSDDSDSAGTEETPAAALSADQIRRNARDLLQSSPGGDPGKTTMGKSPNNAGMPSGCQSYQDAPTVQMSNAQLSNPTSSAANPPWADHAPESGLSVTEVASMAFACVAHCLTEGYRAASNYYGGYHQEQFAPVSGPNNSRAYRQVAGYGNEAYSGRPSGYGDGYQSKFSDKPPGGSKEVMDRGQSSGQGTEQATQQAKEQKEEWATVSVPSTYQGGRVGSGH